jgi:two-component system cell cycle response regulator
VDSNELLARVRTQVKRKRYTDHLRTRLEETVETTVLDPLTALHNRRYMTSHLKTLFDEASQRGKPLSVLPLDIDYFKAVNDSYGHDAGDSVLREFAALCAAIFAASTSLAGSGERNSWWRCPIPMSPKPISSASACVSASPRHPSMPARGCGDARKVTASVGVAALEFADDTPALILKRVDQALCCAKRDGRNRVVADAA